VLTRGENRLHKKILSYEVLIERLLFHADDYHTTKQPFVDRSISAANDHFGSVTGMSAFGQKRISTQGKMCPPAKPIEVLRSASLAGATPQ
jgi:hypothetical protein